ncbi:MAG: tetratricopeptide repeat protein [Fidelibacterota bacterium]
MRQILLLLILVPLGLTGQRDYLDSLFVQANKLYELRKYAEAANTYNRIVRQGYSHPNLYYNLGNAYYQLGRLGDAIWAYEKGLQLRPRDADLRFNLMVSNARTVDRVEVPDALFFLEWYGSLKRTFSPRQWLNLISLTFFVSGLFYFGSRFGSARARYALNKIVVAGLTITVLSGLIFADRYFDLSEKEEAIVIAKEGNVRSAPSDISNLLFVVHEGTKAAITNVQDPWVEIELIDGKKGWALSNRLRML